jgi:signal transduction histidine kinase
MKIFKSFYFTLSWRLGLLVLTSFGLALVVFRLLEREALFTLLVGLLLLAMQVYFLGRYLFRINRVLVSFVDSVGSVDATELQLSTGNTLISSLELRLNQLKAEVTNSRFEQQKQKGLLDIVVDSMDTGLICINLQEEVVFSNKAVNTLFQDQPITSLADIERLNPSLGQVLKPKISMKPIVTTLPQFKASVRSRDFVLDRQEYTLYTIQNIQREVDAQETESWQKLIRVLTHEIMNSMGPILSLSKSLKKSMDQSDKVLTGLTTIENTGEGLIQFIREYRKLSSLPPPDKKLFSIIELLNRLESLFSEEFKNRPIELQILVEDPEMKLYADPHQVEQILINLIKNALESLETSRSGVIRMRAMQNGNLIQLQVEDNGPGISNKINDQIFVPFFSTKARGTGIGLSLSRQIMNNLGGTIQFASIPNEKTVFTLSFPRS